MKLLKRRKWMPDVLEAHFTIPFFEFGIQLMKWCWYSDRYVYISVFVKIYKWKSDFIIGKTAAKMRMNEMKK